MGFRPRDEEKSLASLEADVAYFDARLSLTAQPRTLYQLAQVKTYHELQEFYQSVVERRRKVRRSKAAARRPDSS